MSELKEQSIDCPYCGERISVLLDEQDHGEQYIEDCQVCCRPIVFHLQFDHRGELAVSVYRDDDVI